MTCSSFKKQDWKRCFSLQDDENTDKADIKYTIVTFSKPQPTYQSVKKKGVTVFWISPLPSKLKIYEWYQIVYQNSEFRLSQVNNFRLINQGHGSTLKLCHPLLSCKITNKTYFLFELSISSLSFKLSKNAWKERQQQSQWQRHYWI